MRFARGENLTVLIPARRLNVGIERIAVHRRLAMASICHLRSSRVRASAERERNYAKSYDFHGWGCEATI